MLIRCVSERKNWGWGVDWITLAQDRGKWRALVHKMLGNYRVFNIPFYLHSVQVHSANCVMEKEGVLTSAI
jgi:hypothetical protein